MKRELDPWYELWERVGSEGLDNWYEVRGAAGEAGNTRGCRSGVGDPDGELEGLPDTIELGLDG
ncbi:MAG TPA: hypothetical protein VFJ72_06180 [Rubrobacteraceae bacterium]|nr:hypothetical protein [Rubrobacteraceae bacterium]